MLKRARNQTAAVLGLLTISTLILSACAGATPVARVEGRVIDATNGVPVSDAVVKHGNTTTRTDDRGSFSIARPQMGSSVVILKPGYEPVEVKVGTETELIINLTPAAETEPVRGVVTISTTENPLSGVIVTDGFNETVTDVNGGFELFVTPGTGFLVFSAQGFEQKEIPPDTEKPMQVSLRPMPGPTLASNFPDRLPPETLKETFLENAHFPVTFVFAPDGRMFYNELRTGKIRIVQDGVLLDEPMYDFDVALQPETGLIGLELDPDFLTNHYVYLYYTASGSPGEDSPNLGPNQLVRLTEEDGKGIELTSILPNVPSGFIHNAGNIHFGPDGKLYLTTGNTNNDSLSQGIGSLAGKILRMDSDGSVPGDNPMLNVQGANPLIYAYGFRNSFDFAFHPVTGQIFATENGPGDNDELNLVLAGKNYGWPPSGFQQKPGLENPLVVFTPVIAPTGIDFYSGNSIPSWKNDLFMASYHQGLLQRMLLAEPDYERVLAGDFVTSDAVLGIRTGPDGALYFSSPNAIHRVRRVDLKGLPPVPAAGLTATTPTPETRTIVSTPGAGMSAVEVEVKLTEWDIGLSMDAVAAGRVRFIVKNEGTTIHSLGIHGEGIDVRTPEFPPGETRILEVDLPVGVYLLDCPVGGHTELGMRTKLMVRGKP